MISLKFTGYCTELPPAITNEMALGKPIYSAFIDSPKQKNYGYGEYEELEICGDNLMEGNCLIIWKNKVHIESIVKRSTGFRIN